MNETTEAKETTRRALMPSGAMRPTPGGGLSFMPSSYFELREMARDMASGGITVRQQFRENIFACMQVICDALHWGMLPTQVMRKAYVIKDTVCYEAQLIHAVVNTRAGLVDDLEVKYEGEGPTLRCVVTGTLDRGKRSAREYKSPMLKDIKTKNSPLWESDPEQQLHYFGTRNWARRWCPEVILGVYTKEEIQTSEITAEDRALAIEHRASVDLLDDDTAFDPDAPLPSSDLPHRYSYALEHCANQAEIMAAQMKYQPEIEAAPEEAKGPLRELLKAHLRRVRGESPFNDVMAYSAGFRAPRTAEAQVAP